MAYVTIRPRRDTAANWTSYNPVLSEQEIGIEIGTSGQYDKFKIGDGATHWKDLSYALDLATANSTIDAKVTSSSTNAANAANSASAAATSAASAQTSLTQSQDIATKLGGIEVLWSINDTDGGLDATINS